MPNGSCGYRSRSWQHQSWRKLKEEERWKGDTRRKSLWAPSVPPCLSHLVVEMWEQLLVVISFLLFKNGFEFGRQMRTARESKRHLRQKLCTHLLVIKSEPAPQLIAFYFYWISCSCAASFPLFMPSIPLSFPSSSAFPSPVFSHPLFLLPPCHRCLIIYEVLKNLLCNQGYQNVIHFQWNPSSVFFSSGMMSCQNDCTVWPVVPGGSLAVFRILEMFKIQILTF